MLSKIFTIPVRITALSSWADVQQQVDSGRTTPDLTMLMLILASVLFVGLSVYVIVRLWLNAKREREKMEKEMRVGIPHIKALDNNLPGNSLSTLYKESKMEKEKKKE